MRKVTIIGAGFSGLTLARACLIRGLQVEVLEKKNRVGGLIQTIQKKNGLAEKAAPSISRTDRFDRLLQELGLETVEPAKDARKRLFFVDGLTRWPLSFFETLALLARGVISKIRGSLRPVRNETVGEWGRRILTATAVRNLIGGALQGIYAGDVEKMSASLVLGGLFNKNREKYRGLIGIKGGTENLIRALAADVQARGGLIQLNCETSANELRGPTILAISPTDAADFFQPIDPDLSRTLSQVSLVPIVTMTLFFKEKKTPKAFGCLVPRGQGLRTVGILFNDSIFPGRDRLFSETWILGGATDPEIPRFSDQEFLQLVTQERKKIFGEDRSPDEFEIVRWDRALPHYDLILEKLLRDLQPPRGIWFHGNWLGGIGLSKILERSDLLADELAQELQ